MSLATKTPSLRRRPEMAPRAISGMPDCETSGLPEIAAQFPAYTIQR